MGQLAGGLIHCVCALLTGALHIAAVAVAPDVQEADEWRQTVERLRATTEKEMWRTDLEAFELVGDLAALECVPSVSASAAAARLQGVSLAGYC